MVIPISAELLIRHLSALVLLARPFGMLECVANVLDDQSVIFSKCVRVLTDLTNQVKSSHAIQPCMTRPDFVPQYKSLVCQVLLSLRETS